MTTPKKTTIALEMQVGDATFLKIAKLAHANNCTFNEMVNDLLVDALNTQTSQSPPVPLPVPVNSTVR